LYFYRKTISMFNSLLYTVADKVATISLNRPDVFNAFNDELTYELQEALKRAERDTEVRAVVLTGEGKAFCSGQDLKAAMAQPNRSFSESIHKRYNPIIRAIRNMPKPVICRLNGVAAGAGCSLALACDFIVASENATLIEVFVNIGLVLDSGSSYFLPRLVGSAKAFELSTMGSRVKAAEALQLGLVNRVVPADELDAMVKSITDYYANAPTKSIALMKRMLNKSFHSDLDTMLDYEAQCQDIAGATHDYKEGVTAFLEKRPAAFKGN
jgi:2-(1,2-epoxy-1,2-dihydrophenyl)acetyl-CoA isomerase